MRAKLGDEKGLVWDDRPLYRMIKNKQVLALLDKIESYVCHPYRYLASVIDCYSKLRWLIALRTKDGR